MSLRTWACAVIATCLLCSFTVGCDEDEQEHFYVALPKDAVAVGEPLQLEGSSQYGGASGCSQKSEESKRSWRGSECDWGVMPAGGATISGSGVFVATEPGVYTVTGMPKTGAEDYVIESTTITVVEAIVHKDGGAGETPDVDPEAAVPIWDNHNDAAVDNGGTSPTFELDKPAVVTYLETYHYNGGQGTGQTGQISLKAADGTVYGPWDTEGVAGQGDVPNAYWIAKPNVELPAGSYTVIDPDLATWSQNGGSSGEGMVRMSGVYVE